MKKIITNQPRNGLSIIEVLTSIVVAMIGVFGVMVLIPFAVKQAKVGMDSDAAVQLARNAYSQFEISGYRNPENWWIPEQNRAYDPATDGPKIFAIDPLGVIDNIDSVNYTGTFPLNPTVNGSLPPQLQFPVLNLAIPAGLQDNGQWVFGKTGMTRGVAQRFFRGGNDLVFGGGVEDLDPPLQIFDRDVNGAAMIRQSKGRISWSAIVIPYINQSATANSGEWSYKLYILAYKIRKTRADDEDGQMAVTQLSELNTGYQSPLTNVLIDKSVLVPDGSLKRDDWVMLINQDPTVDPNVTPLAFSKQIAFCRIVNLMSDSENQSVDTALTLDGPDFNFFDPSGINGAPVGDRTWIIHLKDVIGVFEHTFTPETESNWTVNF
jgi:type II secretory pathway pseudopilin PulG